MRSLWSSTNRWLIWFHRWAGVALCLLFAVWFASGAVLHFVGFPSLSLNEKRAGGEIIDLSRVKVEPAAALARVPHAIDLRLVSVVGRPVYLVQREDAIWVKVAADSGDVLRELSSDDATAVADRFAAVGSIETTGPMAYDQWVVHQRFDPFRPFYRVRLGDSAQTDLYVSTRTGEVVQRTRFSERAWNWAGAVIHWIYFTPLRKSYSAWNQVVWWVSLVGLSSIAVGTWLGVLRFINNRAAGRKGMSPFRGWMRWHHIIGLFASAIVLAWMLSGWLSMDHGRLFSRGGATATQTAALRGLNVDTMVQAAGVESLKEVGPASEITFNAIDGRPFLTAFGPAAAVARIVFLDEQPHRILASVPESLLFNGVARVWPGQVFKTPAADPYDGFYRLAESAPDTAKAYLVAGKSVIRIYLDSYSGRFLTVMDSSRRGYAWIYYALHTFQFPILIAHPDLRTFLILILLALGFAASLTGVVLSVKRLKRQFL
jgi:hypothetical protein